ncbi:MAG: hypothetical protein OKX56_08425 [Dehalobacter sp.]|nr:MULTISPECIES: hypothetical protein [Dehalobacter]MDJ0305920.1 hypothetical protein [Dehalobacter sp.]
MKNRMAFRTPEGKKEVLRIYDALLEQWSTQYEMIHLTTRYGKTFVLAGGDPNAPPLILLHGSGMNSVMWLGDMPTYTKHFRGRRYSRGTWEKCRRTAAFRQFCLCGVA